MNSILRRHRMVRCAISPHNSFVTVHPPASRHGAAADKAVLFNTGRHYGTVCRAVSPHHWFFTVYSPASCHVSHGASVGTAVLFNTGRHYGTVCRAVSPHHRFVTVHSPASCHVSHGASVDRAVFRTESHQLHTSASSSGDDVSITSKDGTSPFNDREELKGQNASLERTHARTPSAVSHQNMTDSMQGNRSQHGQPVHIAELDDEFDILSPQIEPKVLSEFTEPPLMPASFSLASYVERSEVLQKLVQLGVGLSRVEKKQHVANQLLRMNFDPDITEKIALLHRVGVKSGDLGRYLTTNPFLLVEDQDALETRVNYLKSKKFDEAAIAQIVSRAPYFLSFSVERVDRRLGFYQQALRLTGNELRQIIIACPKLVTHKITRAKDNIFLLNRQFGFHKNEVKRLVLSHPRILMRSENKLTPIFDYLHNDMCIPHKLILRNHQVFNDRAFKIQGRHQMLQKVGRDQYDPTRPGYISLKKLVTLPDDAFCRELAMVTLEEYNGFLKTL